MITFIFAIVLSSFTSNLLFKSSLVSLAITITFVLCYHPKIFKLFKHLYRPGQFKSSLSLSGIFIVLSCFLFSYFLFKPQLAYSNHTIYRSPIYWDLHWHTALIQNFTDGDNFPVQNEAFGNVPHTYHFFWGVMTGIYESLGLGLVDAINFFSIGSFFFVLITIIGLGEEFFGTKKPGVIALFLTISSSSLHFVDYFYNVRNQSIKNIVFDILTTTAHPWNASFTTNHHSFYYNGTFFNLFYFIEERQLIIGVLYLLIACCVIYNRKNFSDFILPIVGALMGAYFLWHLHITIMVLCALIFLLIFDKDKKKTLLILTGFLTVFIAHIAYFKSVTQSPWFTQADKNFPRLNFGFSDQENKPFSLMHAFNWYFYSYGLKLIIFPVSTLIMLRKNKKVALTLCSIIIPTFILFNTIQLSPGSIYENHKWLRSMNVLLDLTIAYLIYYAFFKKDKFILKISGLVFILLLTISGFIELMPFLNSKPTEFYTPYPSVMTLSIKSNTDKKSTFVGNDADDIQLAGRRMFLGDILGGGLGLDKPRRQQIIAEIYNSTDLKSFCKLNLSNKINYVEYTQKQKTGLQFIEKSHYFPSINTKNEQVFFVDVKKTCVTYEDIGA